MNVRPRCPTCGRSAHKKYGRHKASNLYGRAKNDLRPIVPWREQPNWRERWLIEVGK